MFYKYPVMYLLLIFTFTLHIVAQDANVEITVDNVSQITELARFNLGEAFSQSIAFRPDGRVVAVSSTEGLRLLNIETDEFGEYLYTGAINDPVYSSDGSTVAGYTIACSPGSCNGAIVVIAVETGEISLSLEYQGFVDYVAFSPDSTMIAYGLSETSRVSNGVNVGTALEPSAIHIVDIATGEDVQNITEEHGILGKLFFSPDGTRLAYNSMLYDTPDGDHSSGTLHIIDIASGEEVEEMAAGYLVTALNPDWTHAAISTNVVLPGFFTFSARPAFIADVATGETITELESFNNYTFNADWTLLAANIRDSELNASVPTLSDAATLETLTTLPIEGLSNSFSYAFSPDSSMIAFTLKINDDDNFYLSLWGIAHN